jgi:signal transduction histidine kinase
MTLPGRVLPVIGDEGQLQRALANLLDNSLKFTPAPGAIDLSLAANGETAVLVVRDSGIGIPAEDVARLFSRFHRGRNTTGYPGSGLGLAIVNEIMARHGGRVTMDSDGNGTTARLTLPCQADGDPNEPHPLTAK